MKPSLLDVAERVVAGRPIAIAPWTASFYHHCAVQRATDPLGHNVGQGASTEGALEHRSSGATFPNPVRSPRLAWDASPQKMTDSSDDNPIFLRAPALPTGVAPGALLSGELHKLTRARRAVATIPPPRTRGVLVVEDDPDLQWKLARMLTVRGNRVVGTSSAEGALELLNQWPVDLVLVDYSLPGISGIDFVHHLAEHFPTIPVVLMTADDSEQTRSLARDAGAIAALAKPFETDTLLSLLRSLPKEPVSTPEPADGIPAE